MKMKISRTIRVSKAVKFGPGDEAKLAKHLGKIKDVAERKATLDRLLKTKSVIDISEPEPDPVEGEVEGQDEEES